MSVLSPFPIPHSMLDVEPKQRAHSSLLAAGLASEFQIDASLRSKIPRSLLRGASMFDVHLFESFTVHPTQKNLALSSAIELPYGSVRPVLDLNIHIRKFLSNLISLFPVLCFSCFKPLLHQRVYQ